MRCKDFMCIELVDGICEEIGVECIGDYCEDWGECSSCQAELMPEQCKD